MKREGPARRAKPSPPRTPGAPGAAARAAAARVVDAVLHHGRSLRAELGPALAAFADPRDRALVEAMVFAVLRAPARPAAALDAWMPRPLPRRDARARALLMVGLAQLDPLGLPAHAAVAATVDAARLLEAPHHAKLVNALLRRALREPMPAADPGAHWPGWLRARLQADWPGEAEAIVAAHSQAPPLWLRVNRLRGSREAYAARLDAAGLQAQADADAPDALRLHTPVPVATLPGFAEGEVSVQDAAAQLAAGLLAPEPGMRVLDTCAAPGGKACHLLEQFPGIELTALDVSSARLARVRENLSRLRLTAHVVVGDARDPAGWWDGCPFERILLDAPCTGSGVVRRHPDIKLLRRPEDVPALAGQQRAMLDAAWRMLAPGGRLLYATCSVFRAENAAQLVDFLARHPEARAVDLGEPGWGRRSGPGRQILPGEAGADGFYYACLTRPA